MRRLGRAVLGGMVAFGLLSAVPAAVFAAQPSCGDTLTSNTTLTADLDCSGYTGTALSMGKNKVVLDLNGHTIWGYAGSDTYTGVDTNGYHKTVIKNGTIANAGYAIYVSYSNETLIKNVEISGEVADSSSEGIYVYYGVSNQAVNVNIHDVYYGFDTEYAANSKLLNSKIHDVGYGIYTYYDSHDLFKGNVIDGATQYGAYDYYSGNQRYVANTAKNGGSYGYYLDCETYGIVTLKNNVATNNSGDGFYMYECYADSSSWAPGTGAVVSGNTSTGNGGYGFYDYYSINSTWTNNVAKNNDSEGFYVEYPGGDSFTYNKANHNGGDGFYFYENYGSGYYNVFKFSWNTANYNDSYGFDADYGMPGKGNKAKGNGSTNCYNVRCN
jgi:hypothetical protein